VNAGVEREGVVTISSHQDWAVTLAGQLVTSAADLPETLTGDERLALAWALKDRAIAAWTSSTGEVARAADTLQALCTPCEPEHSSPADDSALSIRAIAEWISGIADLALGRMTDAIAHLDRAAAAFRQLGDHRNAAQSQIPKVMALSVLGLHAQAIESGEQTQRELVALGDLRAAGKVSLNLGNLHSHSEANREALLHYEQAHALATQVGDSERLIMSEIGMANAHTALGNFRDAQQLFDRAGLQAKELGFPVLESLILGTASLLHLARGEYQEALAQLENSRRRFEALDIPQHLATIEKLLADIYLELRLLPEALALFDRALKRFEALEMPVDQAWAQLQRGRTLAALARPIEEVADCLHRAWGLFTTQGVNAGQANVLLARAEIALANADPVAAEMLARSAADAFDATALTAGRAQADVLLAQALLQFGDSNAATALFESTLTRARESQLLSIDIRCQTGLGLIAQARGETTRAETILSAAIMAFEEQRRVLPGDDLRNAFLVDHLRPYEALLQIALDASDRQPSIEHATKVLDRVERFRARVLGERLVGPRNHAATGTTDTSEADLRARLSWLYRRAQKLRDEGEDSQSLISETRRAEYELLELGRRRRLTSDASVPADNALDFDVTRLQGALREHDALIEYGVVGDELFACVVTRSRVELKRRLASWAEVVTAIRTARFQIETMRYGAGTVDRHLDLLTRRSQIAMHRVHNLVWAPLGALLADVRSVLVVPHEQLGAIQFAALHDGTNYLAHSFKLAVVPSARTALHGLMHPPSACERAVVVGESSRLPHAAEEARFVAALFSRSQVLVDKDADAPSLRAASQDADVLHLACHGEFRSDNPMFSALHLADGPFTVSDTETLRLRQGIVVLSACETGVAAYSRGDEMIGLVRAFMLAGAARVVASMWPVDDAITVRFMTAFYRSLHEGNTPANALRDAQLELMHSHPHPFHWAAFTLYGGW